MFRAIPFKLQGWKALFGTEGQKGWKICLLFVNVIVYFYLDVI